MSAPLTYAFAQYKEAINAVGKAKILSLLGWKGAILGELASSRVTPPPPVLSSHQMPQKPFSKKTTLFSGRSLG
jgi:hypothetical protein